MDFNTEIDRRNTNSLKWRVKDGELAMWVADMDFMASPAIRAAIAKKLDQGVFGYNCVCEEFYNSVISFYSELHSIKIARENLSFVKGVVPAISSLIKTFSGNKDGILLQSPVYGAFYRVIKSNNRRVVESPLIFNGDGYEIDFDDLKQKLKAVQMMILCNPHNPIGKVFSREDLAKIALLAREAGVIIISDEIHSDIVRSPFTPFYSVEPHSISLNSPSKAFNIASIHSAFAFGDEKLIKEAARSFNRDEICDVGAFSMEASIAAYNDSREWLKEVKKYLFEAKDYAASELKARSVLRAIDSDATYLSWIDCSKICDNSSKFCEYIRSTTGLYISKGADFGSGGEKFLRLNVATNRARLQDGINRLISSANSY